MRIIGLTGGIACGKSTISQTLSSLGAVIVDGDLLSRELTCPGGVALPDIRSTFGDAVFAPDGTLNRRALGARVFSSPAEKDKLDALMQPLLRQQILLRIDKARQSGAAICVLDMPLLFEAGLDSLCDTVWCATLPRETQLQRLQARDGFTRQEAENRLNSQMPTEKKARRADVVISTVGEIAQTQAMIPPLYAAELAHEEASHGKRTDFTASTTH